MTVKKQNKLVVPWESIPEDVQKKINKGITILVLWLIFWFVLTVAFICVAIHFIMKFW